MTPELDSQGGRAASKSRRLLVVTYYFPPDGAVGGLRWSGMATYLAKRGWEVHVVTAATRANELAAHSGFHVHVVPRRRTLDDVYKSLRARKTSKAPDTLTAPVAPSPEKARKGGPRSPVSALLNSVRRLVSESLYYPDYARGWITRAAFAVRRLLRTQDFALVISSGPPHSAHMSAVFGAAGTGVPVWMDMRDPWTIPLGRPDLEKLRTRKADRLIWLERRIFARVQRAIAVTPEFADVLRVIAPGLPVSYISNGIDAAHLPARTTERFDGCSIAYVGTLYANRNLTVVLEAMSQIVRAGGDPGARLKLRIAGPMDGRHRDRFIADLTAAGIGDRVEVLGVVPRQQALELLGKSHLALVLAQNQPLCIPAKLYECVALGVPTLVVAEVGSASRNEAQRVGALACAPDDVAETRSLVEAALAGKLADTIAPAAPISYAEIAEQMERLIDSNLSS